MSKAEILAKIEALQLQGFWHCDRNEIIKLYEEITNKPFTRSTCGSCIMEAWQQLLKWKRLNK